MKKRILVAVALGAVVLVAGGLMASNMGFKLAYQLDNLGINAVTGFNTLALPYNQQTSLVTASDLAGDINASAAGTPIVSINRLVRASDTLATYPPQDFALAPGDGLLVALNANGGLPVNYVVVGSHAPGLVIPLLGQLNPASNSGTNLFSYPYHAVAGTASALEAEIELLQAGSVTSISAFVRSNDTLQTYPPADFALQPGKAYFIGLAPTALDIAYVPAHF
jgi:hypothetical protein